MDEFQNLCFFKKTYVFFFNPKNRRFRRQKVYIYVPIPSPILYPRYQALEELALNWPRARCRWEQRRTRFRSPRTWDENFTGLRGSEAPSSPEMASCVPVRWQGLWCIYIEYYNIYITYIYITYIYIEYIYI